MLTAKFLRLQSFFFRLLGLQLLEEQKQHRSRSICCLLSIVTFLPLSIAFGLRNIHNMDRLTETLCSVLVDLLALCKIGCCLGRYEQTRRLIRSLHEMLEREHHWEPAAAIISRQNERDQFISSLYTLCFLVAGFSACLMSPLNMIIDYWRTGQLQPDYPFPSVYPWDNRQLHNYLFSYLWNVCAALGVALSTICVDTLFCSLTHNLCAVFEICRHKMKSLRGSAAADSQRKLRHIFHLYGDCLDFGSSLNRLFRPLIFAQFIAASLHLCVLCYQLSTKLLQPGVLFYAAFMASMLCQLAIYCHGGSCVQTESQLFAQAIYDSDWLELLLAGYPAVGRSLQIAMTRAQRGSRIDGYFFEANRKTFVLIVRTAISYVTLLRSFS
ncbi:putative odorant receptor 98b [Drosophila guanche]|uniref:Odorant receptor n=1 Tax=Drosophila guanche TaxID=7266 RepID=A0A3B0JXP5_DROGU|nr:putative odorant receptor 98b [Drosophila guanche]SPP80280.1 blast:Putative odorant receptor 98b [Drosophila guanche]